MCVSEVMLRRAWVARAGEGVRGDRVNEKAARGPAGWCAASGMVRARRPSWGAGEAPRVRVKEVMLRRERERGVRERQRASRPGGVRPRTRRPENQPAWRAAAPRGERGGRVRASCCERAGRLVRGDADEEYTDIVNVKFFSATLLFSLSLVCLPLLFIGAAKRAGS